MGVEDQGTVAENPPQRPPQIGSQPSDMVVETDDDMTARLDQRRYAHEGRLAVGGVVKDAVADHKIHRARTDAGSEQVHLKETYTLDLLIGGELPAEPERGQR